MKNYREYIENNTLRLEASRRGGGIEIDAAEALGIDGALISAYQNYLGGGMLGAVCSSRNFTTGDKRKQAKADKLAEELKKYYHNITNEEAGDYDEWASSDYEANQARPVSGY